MKRSIQSRFIHYHELRERKLGRRLAASMSGIDFYFGQVKAVAFWLVFLGCVLYLLSDKANAIGEAADNRVATKLSNQASEIDALRKIVAACLGDREGAIFIGGELHLCRAVPTGVKQ